MNRKCMYICMIATVFYERMKASKVLETPDGGGCSRVGAHTFVSKIHIHTVIIKIPPLILKRTSSAAYQNEFNKKNKAPFSLSS